MNGGVGLALGGGAEKGFAHIGVIKALKDNGIPISMITGTSMGSIVGAFYALHLDLEKMIEKALNFSGKNMLRMLDFNNPFRSLIKGRRFRRFFTKELFGKAEIEETQIPLAIMATKLEDGSEYVFKKGSIVEAVIASSLMPGTLEPVKKDGFHLVDGGIAASVPLKPLKEMGAKVKIGVSLTNIKNGELNLDTFNLLDRSLNLAFSKLTEYQNQEAADKATIILKPKIYSGLKAFSYNHAEEYIKRGEEVALENMDKIKKVIKNSNID